MPDAIREVRESLDTLMSTFEAYKSSNDERLTEIAKLGDADPVLEERLKKIDDSVQESSDEVEKLGKSVQERLDTMDVAVNRVSSGDIDDVKEGKKAADFMNRCCLAHRREQKFTPENTVEYAKAWDRYLRVDDRGLTPDEARALAIGSDPDGGYWVVPDVAAMINAVIFESSPIRELASVMDIGSKSVTMVIDFDEASSGWLGETEAPSTTDSPQIKQKEIIAHTGYAMPKATSEMLDDANIDVDAWLARKVGEKLARQESTAFVLGTGVGQPRGFMTYTAGTSYGQVEQVASLDSADVTFDGLISVQNALKEAYQRNAVWLFKRSSFANIRKLKDGVGQYLWQPNSRVGEPASLLGAPTRAADDIAAIAGSALSGMYGDLRAAYQIVDRFGIRIIRDNLTNKPFILFFTTKRVGGDLVNFEAIKILKIAAS